MSVLVAGAAAVEPGICHRALPADGCRHHLPPRLRLHAGHALRAGGVLRHWSSRWAAWCRRTSRIWATPVLIVVMLIAAFLFQPIRNWIQERLDRYFYQDRYDYRRTLVEFARELSSETDLDTMLASVGDRLLRRCPSSTWLSSWRRKAQTEGPAFRLKKAMGANPRTGRRQPTTAGPELPGLETAGRPTCSSSARATSSTPFRAPGRPPCAAPSPIWTSLITCPARCAAAPSLTSA